MESQVAWNEVWSSTTSKRSYGFLESRFERAQDKLGLYISRGISFGRGERVLEAGCGDGLILLSLLRHFDVSGYGVDFSETAKKQAENLMSSERKSFSYKLADIRQMPFEDGFFDKIICLGVVEHLPDPVIALKETSPCPKARRAGYHHDAK